MIIANLTAALLVVTSALAGNAEFQAVLDQARDDRGIPGVSAVVTRGDEVVFAGASGFADIQAQRPMTADTPLYCGSVSKVFTAALTMQLIEQTDLSIDSPVAAAIDSPLAADQSITVGHLLTHTSGLEREGDFGYWFSGDFPGEVELRDYLSRTQLRSAPGQRLHYSNVGYATLGLLVEVTSGEDFGTALRDRILHPLGMHASTVGEPQDGIARGYTPVGRVLPSAEQPFAGVGERVDNRFLREYHLANAMTPAFGIQTTALDLSLLTRFLLGHADDDILSPSARIAMRTRQAGGRGFGLRLDNIDGNRVARHGGWFAAHKSHLLIDVENDISVVVMTNSDSAAPEEIVEALYREALGEE